MKYELINYFDTYFDEDSWIVNNQCVEESDIYMDENISKKEICTFLKKIGYLNTDDMRKLCVEDYGDIIEILEKKNLRPLYGLYPIY